MKTIQLRDHAQDVKLLPVLKVDEKRGKIEFTGYCLPLDVIPIFNKIEHVINRCLRSGKLEFSFSLTHFNTPSSKMIHVLLKNLQKRDQKSELTVLINWYYNTDDYEMLEAGEEFAQLVPRLSFSCLEISS